MKKIKKLTTIWMVVLIMLFNLFPFGIAYAADINKSVLKNLTATVTQDGVTIPQGGTITSNKPIRIDISFGVPVLGDSPTPEYPVQKGDTVTFDLSNAFTVIPGTPIELKNGSIVVGHATFTTDPNTKMVTATVVFDGDASVFLEGTSNVNVEFGANFDYDNSGNNGNTGNHTVTILEKSYTVNVPALPIVYDVTKAGITNLSDQTITWKVNVAATQGSTNIDLAGYKFFDDLQNVGEYIAGSFQIGGETVSPDITNSAIGYVFPNNSTSPKEIIFKTKISDSKYYATSEQKVSNKAQLLSSESVVLDEGQVEVKFTPKWIEKTGLSSDGSSGIYDPTNRTITWTITANHYGASLNNAVITDVLPSGLSLKSANWKAWNGSDWDSANQITPNTFGEYAIGNINTMILLTIVTSVPDESYTTGRATYSNSASIRWENSPGSGLGTGSIIVGVGYNAISKSGVADTSNQKIRWTVNVDTRGQNIPSLKVYDLLVYGNTITLSNVSGIPVDILSSDLTPRYGQKYAGNFDGSYTMNVIPIMQGGTRVADLLEITGLSIITANAFSFDSQVLDPNIFAGNKTSNVLNTGTLFSATTKLNAATATVGYTNRMLRKEMLKREAMSNPAVGVNTQSTSSASAGFDYQDKSVIFRLNINADSINLSNTTNAAGLTLGAVTLTDTLPAGWEFTDIVPGLKYLGFEGTGSGSTVLATDTTPDTVPGLVGDFSIAGTATFTISSLEKPFVILVKAKPTNDTAAAYFDSNKTTTVRNNVTLKSENWTTGVNHFQDVTITSKILDKTTTQPKAGELRWTVDYKPYDIAQPGEKLEDQLPAGIDLRMDASGSLVIADNITVNNLTLNADGSYTTGSSVELVLGTNVSYNNATRVLSFIIPDSKQAYRFSYLTDITGEPGTITNKVFLIGGSTQLEETSKVYLISALDGSASFQRNGWISIKKSDEDGVSLAGAEFTLFAMDGTTVIKKGITGSDGIVKLKVIPDGTYILRETMAPAGYTLEGVGHSLKVTTSGSTVTSSIDGKTGANANTIIVQNFSEGTAGNLTISKEVAGDGADKTKTFDIKLTMNGATGTYTYIGHGLPGGIIKNGDTISLMHGQNITITGLPKDATYVVTEEDYSGDGYTMTSNGTTGSILADATRTAAFTNTKTVGNLTISKTVTGNAGDTSKKFEFTLTLEGAAGSYAYTGNGVSDGIIKSGESISLAHGQSITIEGLPKGATYRVAEKDYSGDGYTTTSTGTNGTIVADVTQIAAFTNNKGVSILGKIVVTKTGEGQKVLAGATFSLYNANGIIVQTGTSGMDGKVTFDNLALGNYTFKESGAPEGYLLSNETVSVKVNSSSSQSFNYHNEKLTVTPSAIFGSIRINKIDEKSNALAGATFTIYDDKGIAIGVSSSGADGVVEFKNLPVGTYSIKETSAPTGYKAVSDSLKVEIKEATQQTFKFRNLPQDVVITNVPDGWIDIDDNSIPEGEVDEPQIPNTSGVPAEWLYILGIIMMLQGFYLRKSFKRKKV